MKTWTLVLGAIALSACSTSAQQSAAPSATTSGAAASTVMAPAADPYATASFADPQLQAGHDVFQKWCAPCHAPGPGHPGTQALAVKYKEASPPLPAALEARTDLTPDVVKFFVRGGVSIMPPFRKTEITDADLDALSAYLARPH